MTLVTEKYELNWAEVRGLDEHLDHQSSFVQHNCNGH